MSPKTKPYRFYPSTRLLIFVVVLIGCTILGCGFSGFNFAIVCMVNETAVEGDRSNVSKCGLHEGNTEDELLTKKGYDGEFHWDRSTQANLLAAHAWGAMVMNVPCGILSDRYGAKVLYALSLIGNAVANALTPTAAYAGQSWLFAARVFQGAAMAMAWPPVLTMISKWGTPTETGMLVTLGIVGYQTGPLICMSTSGLICNSQYRWPMIFYIWAAFSGLFGVFWWFFYTDNPSQCRFISQDELEYIEKNQLVKKSEEKHSFKTIPWKPILTSPCVLVAYICQFSSTWAQFYVGEFMPTYSKEVLNFNVNSNGFTAALPPLTQVISRLVMGPIADKITFGGRSKTFSTKFFTATCSFIPALCFLSLSFLDCRYSALAVTMFCLATTTMSTSSVGYFKASVMVAPMYAGVIGAIGNMIGDVGGIIMPYVTGAMIKHHELSEWRGTLYLIVAILTITGVLYMIFGTAQEQPWAKVKRSSHKVFVINGKSELDNVSVDSSCDQSSKY